MLTFTRHSLVPTTADPFLNIRSLFFSFFICVLNKSQHKHLQHFFPPSIHFQIIKSCLSVVMPHSSCTVLIKCGFRDQSFNRVTVKSRSVCDQSFQHRNYFETPSYNTVRPVIWTDEWAVWLWKSHILKPASVQLQNRKTTEGNGLYLYWMLLGDKGQRLKW